MADFEEFWSFAGPAGSSGVSALFGADPLSDGRERPVKYYIVALALIYGLSQEASIPGPVKVVLAILLIGVAKGMNVATEWAFDQGAQMADEALGNSAPEGEDAPEGEAEKPEGS